MNVPSYRDEGRIGSGSWDAFPAERIPEILAAAESWRARLAGVDKPWLCWCLDDSWCLMQQRLILAVGWTPVVGNDATHPRPPVLEGSVQLDFNAELRLPRLHRVFPLEWVHLFAERLAFWHSDMLLSKADMRRAADCFERLPQGAIAIDWCNRFARLPLIRRLWPIGSKMRVFEVLGCVTREASRSQYDEGLGFWRHIERHPNNRRFPPDYPHWEHSIGVSHWVRRHPDARVSMGVDLVAGHANSWHVPTKQRRDMSKQDLLRDENLAGYARRLGIDEYLD